MDFDAYSRTYEEAVQQSISYIGKNHEFFLQAKARHLLEITRRQLGSPQEIDALDVGCGIGLMDSLLVQQFKTLHAVDMASHTVQAAAERNPTVQYRCYDGSALPYKDHSLDLVFAVNVMHHVPPQRWLTFLREAGRVTRPGGVVAIFEHNPYNPLTRFTVARCEFDEDAVLLRPGRTRRLLEESGLSVVERFFILFFPFSGPVFEGLERALRCVPLGAQYVVAGKKPAVSNR